MKPKKLKVYINKTADDLDLDKTLVEDIISFYWKNVRLSISNLESSSVTISNLGTFKIRSNKINRIKENFERHISILSKDSMTFDKHTLQKVIKDKLNRLNEIEKEIKYHHKRKEKVRKKREEYVNNKNLESKESDF